MDQQKNTGHNNPIHSDEIDLGLVYNGLKRFFLNIWGGVVNTALVFKKRWGLVLTFLALGTGSGIGLFYITSPTYVCTLTLSSSVLTNDYCADLIEDLELIVKDNTPKLLAKKLNIDTATAKAIKKMEFFNYDEKLKEKYKDKDTIVLGMPFKVRVYASNNTVFHTLESAIVNYLENNEYALQRREIKQQNLELLQNKINTEQTQLDSLKKNLNNNLLPRGNASGFVFGQPIDPINIYREGLIFFQKELDLNKELKFINNIQIITGFSPRNKPDSPLLWKSVFKGILLGLFSGILLAFLLESRKKENN